MGIASLFRRGAAPGAQHPHPPSRPAPSTRLPPCIPAGLAGRTIPVVQVEDLIEHHAELIEALRTTAQLAREDFSALVVPTLRNLADHFQLLPASEEEHHSDLGGAFRHSIEVAIHAARLSFSKDLTGRAQQERSVIAHAMRVTLVLGALMHDAGKPATDIEVHGTVGKDRVPWFPYRESLTAWATRLGIAEYDIDWIPSRYKRHEIATGMFLLRLVDRRVIEFITDRAGRHAMNHLLACLGALDTYSVVAELVQEADHATSLADLKAARTQRRGAEAGHRADRMISVVREYVAAGRWRLNTPGGWIWLLDTGLFLTWPVGWTHILSVLREREEKGYPDDPAVALDWLIKRGLAVTCFVPGEGERNLSFFAPATLQSKVGNAMVLSGVRLSSLAHVFGENIPPQADRDLLHEVKVGRMPYSGVTLPTGLMEGAAPAPAPAAAPGSPPTAPDPAPETTGEAPPPTRATAAAPAPVARPEARPEGGSAVPEAVEMATTWLREETAKGGIILREIIGRLIARTDAALQWGVNASVWRDRLVLAWPDAIEGLGMEPKDALRGLIEFGVLHQEAMRGLDGFTHKVRIGKTEIQAIALKEAASKRLLPLVEWYVARAGQAPTVGTSPPEPASGAAPPPATAPAPPAQPSRPSTEAHSTHEAPDAALARDFLVWFTRGRALDAPFDETMVFAEYAKLANQKIRVVRRALLAGVQPVVTLAPGGEPARLNPTNPFVAELAGRTARA